MSEETPPEILTKYDVRTESPVIEESLSTKEQPPLPFIRLVVDNTKPVEDGAAVKVAETPKQIPQKPGTTKPAEPPFKKGDWIRYYAYNAKVPFMSIAQVEYVDLMKAQDGTAVFQLKTDRGVVFSPSVLEKRS